MIVVIGNPAWRTSEPAAPAGRACEIALAAARRGASVEVVGRTGDDAAGDALLIALSSAGIGHVAVLRDPSRPTLIIEPSSAQRTDADDSPPDAAGREADERVEADRPDAPTPLLEPEDVALGLQYLTAFDVLVVSDGTPSAVIPVAADAAAFAGAQLVVLVASSGLDPATLPDAATVLAAPSESDEGAFATMVGTYAAALDAGADPAAAFGAAAGEVGFERLDASA